MKQTPFRSWMPGIACFFALLAFSQPSEGQELHEAVRRGSISDVEKILANGGDVNVLVERGLTPLHTAADCGNFNGYPAEFSLQTDFGGWREMNAVPDFLCTS